jgi:putative FmdB family regulatory protein
MPIYEYRCLDCGKRSSHLILSLSRPPSPACRACNSARLERLLSRFAAPKSEEARLESLADPSNFGNIDENDPQSMARFMKKMSREMGEDMDDELDAALDGAGDEMGESSGNDLD